MFNHHPQELHDEHSAQADEVLDALTLELRGEFARIEQERVRDVLIRTDVVEDCSAVQRAIAALDMLDRYEPGQQHLRALGLLEALDTVLAAIGASEYFSRHRDFLVEVIADLREQRRKARAMMVRAMRALFNIPLFSYGPELSDYRHRLR